MPANLKAGKEIFMMAASSNKLGLQPAFQDGISM